MRSYSISLIVVLALSLFPLNGCVRSKIYRNSVRYPPVVSVEKVPDTLPTPLETQLRHGKDCDNPNYVLTPYRDNSGQDVPNPSYPCVAFVEFDEKGYTAVIDGKGVSTQLEAAKRLIQRAIHDDPQSQPVIVTFIHGWKHNASPGPPEDPDIQGLKVVLDRLYTYYYAGGGSPLTCFSGKVCPPTPGHVVVGIYLSWRGESIPEYWPVSRTFTVYDRSAAAQVIGNPLKGGSGVTLPDSLNAISAIAHPPGSANDPHQPMLVFVGHSFGGKILERAMGRNFALWLTQRSKARNPSEIPTLADLTIMVNSANDSLSAKSMLDLMANDGVTYRQGDTDLPLFLSVSTTADAATGFLFPVEAAPRTLVELIKHEGAAPLHLQCYDPRTARRWVDTSHIERDYENHTPPHLENLQSHVTLDFPPTSTQPYIATRPAESCKIPAGTQGNLDPIPGHCFVIARLPLNADGPPACNHTPYFIFETGRDIIPDHGTIFTGRFLELIGHFLPDAPNGTIRFPVFQTETDRNRVTTPSQASQTALPGNTR